MQRLPVLLLTIVVIASLAWVSGCSPEGPASVTNDTDDLMTREQTIDFNDPYGGFNMKDEAPAFGEPGLVDEFAEDKEYNDPMESDREVQLLDSSERDRIFLMITWGNLHRDETITDRTDWSGSLSIDPGAILLKRTIHFEDDDMILERTQRDLLEWNSTTGQHLDGILVRIIAAPQATNTAVADTIVDSMNTVITFDTPPVKVEFKLKELPNLREIITLPDGNAVAFHAVRVSDSDCPHGFMGGVWRNHPERQGGEFFGKWETEDGHVHGIMKGHYGVTDDGRKVFFGKMITPDGRFEGIMRGEWGHNRGDEHGGWFRGHWVDRRLEIQGVLKGEWRRSDRCHGGFYRGVWAKQCR